MNLILSSLLIWAHLTTNQQLKLEQDLVLDSKVGQSGIVLKAGTDFDVTYVDDLMTQYYRYYRLRLSSCPEELKDRESDVTALKQLSMTAALEKGCSLRVLVTNDEVFAESPFSEVSVPTLLWSEFSFNQSLKLGHDLVLEGAQKAPSITLKAGTSLKVFGLDEPADSTSALYELHLTSCPDDLKNLSSGSTGFNRSYRIQLEPNCKLFVILEKDQRYTRSPFVEVR